MIKVIKQIPDGTVEGKMAVRAELMADTATEVETIGNSGEDAGADAPKLAPFSTALCAEGGFGVLNSSGVWKF